MKTFFGTSILLAAFCLAACNSSNTLIVEDRKPVIRFEGGTVAYSVKAGREFRLAPEYENVDASTVYLWSCNGEILSRSATLSCVFDRSGFYDIRISAANDAGTSSADITLSVLDAAPPVISLDLPSEGLLLLAGSEYTFSPDVANADDDTAYEWFIGTETVARSREYLFMQSGTGRYDMAFEAENEDGSDRIEFTVEVVDGIAADATFEASYYQADPLRRYVAAGRSVELHPYIWNGIAPTFEWSIDGQTVSTDPSFVFTPQAAGQTEISFTLSDIAQSADRITRHIERRGARRGTVRFTVVCCDEPAMRPTDPSSSPHADKVFDYTEGIRILEESGRKFEFPCSWGCDLQSEHERYLVEEHFKRPVILINYPKEIKAFYMKQNADGKTVRAMDVLFPQIGEIIGGSEREADFGKLYARVNELGMNERELWWYLDTRRWGSAPHSGFGLGFERLLLFVTGMSNIRDVIPFPRTPKNAEF